MGKIPFSKIIGGTITWDVWGKNFSTPQITELRNLCVESRISIFDNAYIYESYTTKESLEKAFGESQINHKDILLISERRNTNCEIL
jgi:predicted oxidoreductase